VIFYTVVASGVKVNLGRQMNSRQQTPLELRAIDKTKLYTAIVDQILEGIRTEALKPGSALPPERVLAEQFAVSRTSVREAIRVLEHSGVVEVRTGSGSYVTSTALSNAALLRTRAALEGDASPLDLVVARLMVEPGCAEQAALHRTNRDIQTMMRLLAIHQGIVMEGADPREIDITFHSAVADCTHNPVLHGLSEQFVVVMRQATWQTFTDHSRRTPGRPAKNLEDHRAIAAAIERGDPEAARRAMEAHLADVEAMATRLAEAKDVAVAAPTPDHY